MLVAKEISWIREQIEKTGKVAPVDVDKLMAHLLRVLNAKLKAKLADEAGLTQILKQAKEADRAHLREFHDGELARETKKLQGTFDSYAQEMESKVFKRIQQAEYAESVVSALEVILQFVYRTWKAQDDVGDYDFS